MKKFLLATALGIALTIVGAQEAFMQRGYFALGGEMFILPAVYFAAYAIPAFVQDVGRLLQEIEEEEDVAKSEEVSRNQKNGSCPDGTVFGERADRGRQESKRSLSRGA